MSDFERALYLASWSAACRWKRAARIHLGMAILLIDLALADRWRRDVC